MSKPLVYLAIVFFLSLVASLSIAQRAEYVLEIHDPPQGAISTISKLDIWGVDPETRTFTAAATEPDLFLLDLYGIDYVVISTVDEFLARFPAPKSAPPGSLDFTDYHDMDSVYAFLDTLAADHPEIVKQYDLGPAWQGDRVVAVKISDNVSADELFERAPLFIGCHHAREWISVEVPLYIALHLVENYGIDPYVTQLVDNLEIWIIPVLNPDGYRYSWDEDRMWRKNRRPPTDGYWGVDLNRNYSYMWGGQGSSGNPWDQTYRGPYPFSEPETQYVKELVESHPNILACLNYHSYGELFLYAWGYTYDDAPDEDILIDVGNAMSDEIFGVHGHSYTVRQGSDNYITSGGANDWYHGEHGIVSYTNELRPKGYPYFELPPEEIIPTCEENLPAALYMAEWVLSREVHSPADWLWPGWNWFSVPVIPLDPTPEIFLGFDCSGILWRFDRYDKAPIAYQPPFSTFELQAGEGYLLWLDEVPVGLRARFEGSDPGSGHEERLGRQGWAWLGKPGMSELSGGDFMGGVLVKYPSDETGTLRTAAEDRVSGTPWLNWGWSWWDGGLQAPRYFTPYAPFGDTVCVPWRGYRAYVNVGTAVSEDDPAQVTLIWP